MEWWFILAQIFGVLALIVTVISMITDRKKVLMILQILSELFYVIQYLLLAGWTAAAMAAINFVRDSIFYKYDKKRAPIWILLLIFVAMGVVTTFTWAGPMSLLPFCGSLIYATSLWLGKVQGIRYGNIIGNSLYVIYMFMVGAYAGMVATVIEVAGAGVGALRGEIEKRQKKMRKKGRK